MTVIDEASDGAQAIQKFESGAPDVVVLDITMPDMDGLEACKKIKLIQPDAKILILTMHPEDLYAVRLLKAGALGYITKTASEDELYQAIRSVAKGKIYLSDAISGSIVSQLSSSKGKNNPIELLSDREVQILTFITRGIKPSEIANTLNISANTVQSYRVRILHKLGLRNNAQLVAFAHDSGLT